MSRGLRLGAKVPNSGSLPAELGIGVMASRLERAGFESLWCSDHVVMPKEVSSPYPFSADGSVTWDLSAPWYDAVVAMSMMAEATSSAEIGVAVLVLPLRSTLVLGKQIASIDALSSGRVVLGAGAGWLAEEFAAVGAAFDSRGPRMDEQIALLRTCWSGEIDASRLEYHEVPAAVWSRPRPVRVPPIIIGGMSSAAIQRAVTFGDGWLALQRCDQLDSEALRPAITDVRQHLVEQGRNPAQFRVIVRVNESAGATERVSSELAALAAVGVTDVIVDVDWRADDWGVTRMRDAIA